MNEVLVKTMLGGIMMMVRNNETPDAIDDYIQKSVRFIKEKDIVNGLTTCNGCNLSGGNRVPGKGNFESPLMLIGEGPGEQEDRLREPFVGPAGQLLDRIISAAGWDRDDLYITNVVKCRAHDDGKNVQPNTQQVAACMGHLREEIELVKPKIIICLGAVAANALIHPKFKMTEEHGRWFEIHPGRWAMAIYHPSYILHKGEGTEEQEKAKADVWEDIQAVKTKLEELTA